MWHRVRDNDTGGTFDIHESQLGTYPGCTPIEGYPVSRDCRPPLARVDEDGDPVPGPVPEDLKGAALDKALDAAGLPKGGSADEKRARLAQHQDEAAATAPTPTTAPDPAAARDAVTDGADTKENR